MFIVGSYTLAVIFCFVTMLCWGSWGNTQKLAAKSWRYELFYWDYVIGMVLFSLLLAFQLAVCLLAALVLFLFMTMGNEQYNSFIEFYKEELQKPVISRSVFDAADLSRLFAGGEVKVQASPDEAEGR